MNFKNILRKKPDSFNREGLIIKPAFVSGGIQYYELDNIFNLPTQRGLAAVRVFNEVKMKCDYDYLKVQSLAIDNIYKNSKKLGFKEMSEIKKLNDQKMDRLFNLPNDLQIVYKLASVAFFDDTESVIDYDFGYAAKKVKLWQRNTDVNEFFFSQPMQRLYPSLKQPDVNFQSFLQVAKKANEIHWESVWELLFPEQRSKYKVSKDFYVEETQQKLVN